MKVLRTDDSVLGRWWWTVDRFLLFALLALCCIGAMLSFSATPAIAHHLKLGTYFLVNHQLVFLGLAVVAMIGISMQPPKNIRLLSVLLLAAAIVLMVGVLIYGEKIKGAARWIRLFGISVQPSEFAKPAFAVVAAWLISTGRNNPEFKGMAAAWTVYAVLLALLIKQPDFGMTMTVSVIFFAELFVAGLPFILVAVLSLIGSIGTTLAYFTLPHVQVRVDKFLHPETGDTYQVRTAFDAIKSGGLFGTGPGEGVIKNILPDAHTDFILAVAVEEFGLIPVLFLVFLFAAIVLRGFYLIFSKNKNLFTLLAVSGILTQFGMQALVNMASTLSMIPTKGMTLPFISYGGSSLLSTGFAMGVLLGLTRNTNTGKESK